MVRVVPEDLTAWHWEAEKVFQLRPALHTVLAHVMPKPQPAEGYPECAPEFETEQVDLQLHYRPVKGVTSRVMGSARLFTEGENAVFCSSTKEVTSMPCKGKKKKGKRGKKR